MADDQAMEDAPGVDAPLAEPVGMLPDEKSDLVSVVATQLGARPVAGLVQPGAAFDIPVGQYSALWMKPANAKAAKAIKAELAMRAAKKSGAE